MGATHHDDRRPGPNRAPERHTIVSVAFHSDGGASPLGRQLAEFCQSLAAHGDGAIRVCEGDGEGPPALPALTVRHGQRAVAHWLAAPTGPEAAPFFELVARLADADPRAGDITSAATLEVFIAAECPHCPRAVAAALAVAVADPAVTVTVIDAQLFPAVAARIPVRSVPTTIVNGATTLVGDVTAPALAAAIAARSGPQHDLEVLTSLIANGRLAAAAEQILAGHGTAAYVALWRTASMEGRIGLTLVAEQVLAQDPTALDAGLDSLLATLDTPDTARRGDTADLLGRIRHPAARPALELLLTDPDEDVAEAAGDALEQIGLRPADG